jgi:hypothetical protein
VYATTDSTGQYLQLHTTDGSTFQININVNNALIPPAKPHTG